MLKRLLFAVLMLLAFASQAAVYSLPWGPKPQFVDANGAPMSSGTISTFLAGSSTAQVTYTDSTGGVANPTTITLNVRGETPNEVWLTGGVSYKLVLKDSSGATVWTVDNIAGVIDVSASVSEWVSGPTPTYVSATSFTLAGDQTTTFHVGRRVKTTNSGGTVYSTITASAFGALTTVTVANDSSTLDAGLSAVSYGLVSANNPSISPQQIYRKGTAVASAGTTDIWGIVGDYVHITGVVTITSLGTAPYAGAERTVIFDGALTLTHNATTLVLPGGASITTAANDRMVVRADTTANMVVVSYVRASTAPAAPIGKQVVTATGATTFTVPAGSTANSTFKFTITGGGAGGGVAAGGAGVQGGVGGSAAATCIKYFTGWTAGNTVVVTIGAAGASATNGTDSTITSGTQTITTVTAAKGVTGSTGGANNGPSAGGDCTNGDVNISGGHGEVGLSNPSNGAGGMGGGSFWGGGGAGGGGGGNNTGSAAKPFGAGGGGGSGSGSSAGGAGKDGVALIEWTL